MHWELWKEDSPCDECKKVELHKDNVQAWALWGILNEFDRGHGAFGGIHKITTVAMSNLCAVYGEGFDTFEKIVLIERIMYPIVAKKMEEAIKNNPK